MGGGVSILLSESCTEVCLRHNIDWPECDFGLLFNCNQRTCHYSGMKRIDETGVECKMIKEGNNLHACLHGSHCYVYFTENKGEPKPYTTNILFVLRHGGSGELALPTVILDWTAEREEEQPDPCFYWMFTAESLSSSGRIRSSYWLGSSCRNLVHRWLNPSTGDWVRNQEEDHGHSRNK